MTPIDEQVAAIRRQIKMGRLGDVRIELQQLAAQNPNHPGVIATAALFMHRSGDTKTAMNWLRQAVHHFPASAVLHAELAQALFVTGDHPAAEIEFRAALQLDSQNKDSLALLSKILMVRNEWEECYELVLRLVAIAPEESAAWSALAHCSHLRGQLTDADAAFQRAISLTPNIPHLLSERAFLSNYREDLSPQEVFAIHREWAERFAPASAKLPRRAARRPGRLRIGYVSPDFRSHSVASFFEPVIQHHDRARVEVTCYSAVAAPDTVTARMRSYSEHWRDIHKISDANVARQVQEDDIDMLIDLAGHTGENRLSVFALKPAAVQMTWLGYPNTTGLSQIDYRLTDALADPNELSQSWHSEELVRLRETFFCYAGPGVDVAPPAPDPPSALTNIITFGVATSVQKIRPPMIRAWAEILSRVPNSRLVIQATAVDLQIAKDWIAREFIAAGMDDLSRIRMQGSIGFIPYLRMHDAWDVALDTLPFNGHTTTCHTLWMGVPIVTLAGQMHASRMGASVLHSLELDHCIAKSVDEYIDIALKLAADVEQRRELRRTFRDRMRQSRMMDGARFTRDLEEKLQTLFDARQD